MDNQISIRRIAELAGVSVATVSRIINKTGRYSKETEARVHEIMDAYHYVPNMLAKGLRTSRNMTIGILIPDITGVYFGDVASTVQSYMFARGYASIILNTGRDKEQELACIRTLQSQQVSGVVHIVRENPADAGYINLPTVYLDADPAREPNQENVVNVTCDNVMGGYLGTKRMLDAGCRNIGILMTPQNYTHVKRLEGYEKALSEYGIAPDAGKQIHLERMSIRAARRAVKEYLANDPFDGIMCLNDAFAIGALKGLLELGVRVPEDVKIVGYDSSDMLAATNPAITTIIQPIDQVGETIANELLRMMEIGTPGEDAGEHSIIIPISLLDRDSV
ncbi:MAG: LacI family DNA-binding transcriptional regulator [Lachnospiraceae bacterium]|nr:LacI family DNA-binding transcriptional regulator [Lachnospiraceae bacterium]